MANDNTFILIQQNDKIIEHLAAIAAHLQALNEGIPAKFFARTQDDIAEISRNITEVTEVITGG